eukprot:355986-Chlamydomonas_euryale.AAC.10
MQGRGAPSRNASAERKGSAQPQLFVRAGQPEVYLDHNVSGARFAFCSWVYLEVPGFGRRPGHPHMQLQGLQRCRSPPMICASLQLHSRIAATGTRNTHRMTVSVAAVITAARGVFRRSAAVARMLAK